MESTRISVSRAAYSDLLSQIDCWNLSAHVVALPLFVSLTAMEGLPAGLKSEIMQHLCSELLMKVPLFARLLTEEPSFGRHLIERLTFESYPAGEFIFQAGEIGESMFFITEGCVGIYPPEPRRPGHHVEWRQSNCSTHARAPSKIVGAGSFCGEVALLTEDRIRTASIRALKPTFLLVLSRAHLFEIMRAHPGFASHLNELSRMRAAKLAYLKARVEEQNVHHATTHRDEGQPTDKHDHPHHLLHNENDFAEVSRSQGDLHVHGPHWDQHQKYLEMVHRQHYQEGLSDGAGGTTTVGGADGPDGLGAIDGEGQQSGSSDDEGEIDPMEADLDGHSNALAAATLLASDPDDAEADLANGNVSTPLPQAENSVRLDVNVAPADGGQSPNAGDDLASPRPPLGVRVPTIPTGESDIILTEPSPSDGSLPSVHVPRILSPRGAPVSPVLESPKGRRLGTGGSTAAVVASLGAPTGRRHNRNQSLGSPSFNLGGSRSGSANRDRSPSQSGNKRPALERAVSGGALRAMDTLQQLEKQNKQASASSLRATMSMMAIASDGAPRPGANRTAKRLITDGPSMAAPSPMSPRAGTRSTAAIFARAGAPGLLVRSASTADSDGSYLPPLQITSPRALQSGPSSASPAGSPLPGSDYYSSFSSSREFAPPEQAPLFGRMGSSYEVPRGMGAGARSTQPRVPFSPAPTSVRLSQRTSGASDGLSFAGTMGSAAALFARGAGPASDRLPSSSPHMGDRTLSGGRSRISVGPILTPAATPGGANVSATSSSHVSPLDQPQPVYTAYFGEDMSSLSGGSEEWLHLAPPTKPVAPMSVFAQARRLQASRTLDAAVRNGVVQSEAHLAHLEQALEEQLAVETEMRGAAQRGEEVDLEKLLKQNPQRSREASMNRRRTAGGIGSGAPGQEHSSIDRSTPSGSRRGTGTGPIHVTFAEKPPGYEEPPPVASSDSPSIVMTLHTPMQTNPRRIDLTTPPTSPPAMPVTAAVAGSAVPSSMHIRFAAHGHSALSLNSKALDASKEEPAVVAAQSRGVGGVLSPVLEADGTPIASPLLRRQISHLRPATAEAATALTGLDNPSSDDPSDELPPSFTIGLDRADSVESTRDRNIPPMQVGSSAGLHPDMPSQDRGLSPVTPGGGERRARKPVVIHRSPNIRKGYVAPAMITKKE
jgi:CRP-like cAMP-binding protein